MYIRSASHSFRDKNIHILEQGYDYKTILHQSEEYSIVIEDNVWIGSNCVLLSGTHLKKGVILGAGSLISSKIDEFSLALGSPARVVRKR